MKGYYILSQSKDSTSSEPEYSGIGYDHNLLMEELNYWTYVARDHKASVSLKDYAASQISSLKSHLTEPRESGSLKKLG